MLVLLCTDASSAFIRRATSDAAQFEFDVVWLVYPESCISYVSDSRELSLGGILIGQNVLGVAARIRSTLPDGRMRAGSG
jgi:hypothetical protein